MSNQEQIKPGKLEDLFKLKKCEEVQMGEYIEARHYFDCGFNKPLPTQRCECGKYTAEEVEKKAVTRHVIY